MKKEKRNQKLEYMFGGLTNSFCINKIFYSLKL